MRVRVLRDGADLDVGEVGAHFAAAGLARQKTTERLVVVDQFPRTAAGKVQKHLLRARLPAAPVPEENPW